ncbi:PepSY-associated TM helix domain-containing protein [Duganella sp. S19_KUP01_CR8]|uniref:PepSY-associated TM helix domain-containing protein n=1 Tax=Duganella sp. S19_KUP01_CR8 TaxID=3025502 RepID=UPI002FCD7C1A
MRRIATLLHRWAGLLIAGFLFISGVTGAVISWDHELDELLNPHLTDASGVGPALPALQLARALEARHPQMQVLSVPMAAEPGHSLAFYVEPRVNPATGALYPAPYNQVFVDPVTGAELGARKWGAAWPITRETFVSFLYQLHYTLHIPQMWGIEQWGLWLMGGIAMIWTVDSFVGFYLTLPVRRRTVVAVGPQSKSWWQRWRPAWLIRFGAGGTKFNFDLHRAFSLWTWLLLFIIAFTAFSLNLYREVFFPVMSLVSDVTPSPFDVRTPTGPTKPIAPALAYAEVQAKAEPEAARRGWREPVGNLSYSPEYGIYSVAFFAPQDEHGAGGVGHRQLYFDGRSGALLGDRQPWKGTAADIFIQAQFPLHSGRILGIPGRVLISLMGLVVATLSVTGVLIWWRKRSARVTAAARVSAPAAAAARR